MIEKPGWGHPGFFIGMNLPGSESHSIVGIQFWRQFYGIIPIFRKCGFKGIPKFDLECRRGIENPMITILLRQRLYRPAKL